MGLQTREEDFVERSVNLFLPIAFCFSSPTRQDDNKMKAYQIPEAGRTAKGYGNINLLQLDPVGGK